MLIEINKKREIEHEKYLKASHNSIYLLSFFFLCGLSMYPLKGEMPTKWMIFHLAKSLHLICVCKGFSHWSSFSKSKIWSHLYSPHPNNLYNPCPNDRQLYRIPSLLAVSSAFILGMSVHSPAATARMSLLKCKSEIERN